jgi:PAS domain S-box-containing protein
MRWSLKTALTLTFVLLASLPILLVGFGAMKYLTVGMEREISEKNLLLADAYASELHRFLDDALHRVAHVARLLEDGTVVSPEERKEYLASQISGNDDLEMLRIIDPQGAVTHLAPFDPNIHGLDMSRQFYTAAAKQQQAAYWSSVFISPQTGRATLVLSIPFKQGMVVGHLSLSAVREVISSIHMAPGGDVAVLDSKGTAIAHSDKNLVAQRANLSNQSHIAQGLLGNAGTFRYEDVGQGRIGSIALVEQTHWVVAVSQPLDQVFTPIRNLKRILYAGIALAVLTAVAAAVFSLQRLLLPLRRVSRDAREIAGGNYTIEPSPTSYTEINELNLNFKSMMNEVKTREASLRASEERFRATFEQAAVGIAHVSPEGAFLRINRRFCEIIRYTHDEIRSLTFQAITHPEDLDRDVERFQRLLRGEVDTYSLEKRYLRGDGGLVWVELTVSLVRDHADQPQWCVAVISDISKRKQAQLALKQMRDYTDHLIETANVMIVSLDTEGRVTHFNPAAETITGYTLSEIKGGDWFELLVPRDRYPEVAEAFSRLKQAGIPSRLENPIVTKNDRERFISWSNSEIKRGHEIIGVTAFGIDITERKQAEQRLHQYQERLKALASQLTVVEESERRRIATELHDHVSQTLALARMQVARIKKRSTDASVSAGLTEISNTLHETLQNTRQLMFDLSPPSLNELGLSTAIAEWLETQIGPRYNIATAILDELDDQFERNLEESVRAILFRNVRELLYNVVKHAQAKKVSVHLKGSNDHMRIVVEDDGVGFDFESVCQTGTRDSGFGLFSIQERMDDLGGSMEIASEPGKGCKTTLIISVGEKR